MMQNYRTPLGRARGLGSAKHGVGAWIGERVTAVALVPLVLWGVYWLVMIAAAHSRQAAVAWLANPINAVLLALLTSIAFVHMHAGMRVVVEDYIERHLTKTLLLLANLFVCGLAGALAVFSILKVALGGA
jgi:succinate dehydrogenase / fumarate reductase membrane anchor subunit